ncbi:hypothetical protein QVD17_26508 [Tagetes erecta]|uniref:Uncharacterized protein n=1 Tax=Tagetes erecta TaxID=13708 RepID=A0AAD8K9K0_TARER|nr:hypothetical protein QVD17_26508 [Tagetes erecta]
MSSSSSQLYNCLLNDDDDTSSDEYEEEMAVTSAMSFVVRGLFEETENTTNPTRKRSSSKRYEYIQKNSPNRCRPLGPKLSC